MNAWTELGRGTTINTWIVAHLFGLFIYWTLRRKREARPILRAALSAIAFGTWLTLLDIFRRLRELSLIDDALWWFLIGALLLLLSAQVLKARFARKDEKPSEVKN